MVKKTTTGPYSWRRPRRNSSSSCCCCCRPYHHHIGRLLLVLSVWLLPACFPIAASTASTAASAATDGDGRARERCDASYTTPCALQNSQWLALDTARRLFLSLLATNTNTNKNSTNTTNVGNDWNELLMDISEGKFNLPTGFYPFAFETATSICVAHGSDASLVNKTLREILNEKNLQFSSASYLHERFKDAAVNGGEFVQYLWSDQGVRTSKLAYVTSVTSAYYVGVGFMEKQLPPKLPCSDKFDSFCSIHNIQSLLGLAQYRLQEAKDRATFEATALDISLDDDVFKIPDGFYLFMYNYDGRMMAHGVLHQFFGKTLAEVFQQLGRTEDGDALHYEFMRAADGFGNGWVQYKWSNKAQSPEYTKVAYVIKMSFEKDDYYLGAGFRFASSTLVVEGDSADCSPANNHPCAFALSAALSSHTLAYLLSSPVDTDAKFRQVALADDFHQGEFYVFLYDFNGTCVAHGQSPEFAGMTLSEVFEIADIDIDAIALNDDFGRAAEAGGGYVSYQWAHPGDTGLSYEKISYLFKFHLDGRDYYGGVGFSHVPAPVRPYLSRGTDIDGQPIPCSEDFLDECSTVNTRSVLGQSFADIVLAATLSPQAMQEVFDSITSGDLDYQVNDSFHVSVFAASGSRCPRNDGSGCCVAHGRHSIDDNEPFVGMTWQDILDSQNITILRGVDLHERLLEKSGDDSLEGYWDFMWPGTRGFGKRAWVSRFQKDDETFYVMSSHSMAPPLPTCDACPNDQGCTRSGQAFCEENESIVKRSVGLILAVALLVAALLIYGYAKHRQKRLHDGQLREMQMRVEVMTEQMKDQMQSVVKITDDLPLSLLKELDSSSDDKKDTRTKVVAAWYWEEDEKRLGRHDPSAFLPETNFVQYPRDVSDGIERNYQQWTLGHCPPVVKVSVPDRTKGSESLYEIDFEFNVQKNLATRFCRSVTREWFEIEVDEKVPEQALPIPEEIKHAVNSQNGEDLLPTIKGQIIQISKTHANGQWHFGNVLFDPLLHDAEQSQRTTSAMTAALTGALAHALHDRPMSGWFPDAIAERASADDMQNILENIGGAGMESLKPPAYWEKETSDSNASYHQGPRVVDPFSPEFDEVAKYFLNNLNARHRSQFEVVQVERIQNLPLYQSYAVKKQTIQTRDRHDDPLSSSSSASDIERRWLFHGTRCEVVDKVSMQGFNRAFAGHNAVRYGKGVYFALDSSYSCSYATAGLDGIQRMFLCRVVVGEYCLGKNGQLTPDPRPDNPLELYDSTVNDLSCPSIFVVYHDAQAFPEYLVSFKSKYE